jgi:hypothetical protein
MGWTAHLAFKNQRFVLTSDRGYIGVEEIVGNQHDARKDILPPRGQRTSISESQVCQLLTSAAEAASRREAKLWRPDI